jgi:hypothetical protein
MLCFLGSRIRLCFDLLKDLPRAVIALHLRQIGLLMTTTWRMGRSRKKTFKSFQSTSPKHAKMLCANNEQRWSTKDKYQKAKNLARLFSILCAIGSKLSSKTRPLPVILWCSSSNSCRSTSSRTRWQGSAEGTSRQSQTRRWVGCWTWKALWPNHWEADGAVIHSHACSYQIETDLAMLVDEIRHALVRHLHDTLLSSSCLPRHEHTWDI